MAVIVTFHGVGDPPRALEAGEERVWLTTDGFRDALDAIAAADDAEITFDDGNASDVEVALPELRARGLRATFFVVADRLGSPGFLSAEDMRELVAAGMAIGSHGVRHVPWRGLDRAELEAETAGSRATLEEALGTPVEQAALPFGSYDRRALRAARAAGYRRVLSSDGGRARSGAWLQPRTSLGPGLDARRVLAGETTPRLGGLKRLAKRLR
jgi:peptidoglycan/xylan/chitin deacetylase (PgdA/CDA1 family)